MTYEQAGSGYAGLTITTDIGDQLTLKDRLTHHHTTGLSTIEITALNATRVVDEFEKFFKENISTPSAPYKTYVIKGDNNPDKLAVIARWMESHSIRFGHPQSGKSARGFDYQTQTTGSVNITTEDLVVNIYQPKSRFITTVFEPQSKLSDSLTYDITAWNLMYAYNLKAYALQERLNPATPFVVKPVDNNDVPAKPYAYLFAYQSIRDVEFLGSLMKEGIRVRAAAKPFVVNGKSYEAGTLIVTRRNNESIEDFDTKVKRLANATGRKINTTSTGFVDKGYDFGSSEVKFLKAPKVAVLFGEQTFSLSTGEIWHYFEQQIHYPITQIGTDYFKSVDLKPFDVLVVPDGNYRMFDDAMLDQIQTWVNGGGKLIVIANALNSFVEKKSFALKNYLKDAEKADAEKKQNDAREKGILDLYGDVERRQLSEAISGAIYKVSLDRTHPLSLGLGDTYYSLKTNELRFGYLEYGWNVGVIKGKAKPVQGFAGARINPRLENSLTIGVEQKGKGSVIYLVDNPLFREFWENGKMLFSNAVFMVN